MITLIKKITNIEVEIANIEEKIIPELQIDMAALLEEYGITESHEERMAVLGKMENVGEELDAERRTAAVLKTRRGKLILSVRPRRGLRGPCGKC